jgi:hypothetical protein
MTVTETQTLLTTISNHLNGKSGTIYSVSIGDSAANVTIDWVAFQSNFSGQQAERSGNIWTKTVGAVTYNAKSTAAPADETVPVL